MLPLMNQRRRLILFVSPKQHFRFSIQCCQSRPYLAVTGVASHLPLCQPGFGNNRRTSHPDRREASDKRDHRSGGKHSAASRHDNAGFTLGPKRETRRALKTGALPQ